MCYKKFYKNKKAISEFILDIWSYIVFIIALFFFFVVFKIEAISAIERQLSGIKDVPTSSIALNNYLRTPVTVDGKQINIAELIRLWHLEPDKYKNILEKTSIDILNSIEYEYDNPRADNIVVRGFNVVVNSKKNEDNSLDFLIDFKSKSFESGFCIGNEYGCVRLGEQFVPVSENAYLYVILFESQKAK